MMAVFGNQHTEIRLAFLLISELGHEFHEGSDPCGNERWHH
jgi:hypothetical protein